MKKGGKKSTIFYTYQTKNLINGKTYIGVRSTNESIMKRRRYLGSGIALKNAVKKYGYENFVVEPLAFFDTMEEAYEEEAYLVDKEWVASKDNYNLCIGGTGGVLSEEHSRAISESNTKYKKGVPLSEEHKAKIRANSTKGIEMDKVTCPFCGKRGAGGSMVRWHFDNCKNK